MIVLLCNLTVTMSHLVASYSTVIQVHNTSLDPQPYEKESVGMAEIEQFFGSHNCIGFSSSSRRQSPPDFAAIILWRLTRSFLPTLLLLSRLQTALFHAGRSLDDLLRHLHFLLSPATSFHVPSSNSLLPPSCSSALILATQAS